MTARLFAILALASGMTIATLQPGRAASARVQQLEENLPLPPLPPANPPIDVPAPVPNVNLEPPPDPVQQGTAVKPTLTEQAPTLPGGDPVPGTLFRSDQEQRRQFIPKPGIQIVVPLEK